VKLDKKTLVTAFTFLLIGIIGTSIVWVYAQPSAGTFYVSEGVYSGAPSYTAWRVSSTYYVKTAWGQLGAYSTNATQVINGAITSAYNNGGGTVYLFDGTYVLDGSIIMKTNVTLYGQSWGTILETDGTFSHIEIFGDVTEGDITQVVVRDLALVGSGSGTKMGVHLWHTHRATVRNMYIVSCGYGIFLEGDTNRDVDNNLITENFIRLSVDTAIRLLAWNYTIAVEENVISNNIIETNGGHGIIVDGYSNTISGNTIEESYLDGILITGEGNTISGNTIRESGASGILITESTAPQVGTGSDNIVDGNFLENNDLGNSATYMGIWVNIGNDNIITSNRAKNNDGWEIYVGSAPNRTIVGLCNTVGSDHVGGIYDGGSNTKIYASWNDTVWIATYP